MARCVGNVSLSAQFEPFLHKNDKNANKQMDIEAPKIKQQFYS